jgi:hypothetical protein
MWMQRDLDDYILIESQVKQEVINFKYFENNEYRARLLNRALKKVLN